MSWNRLLKLAPLKTVPMTQKGKFLNLQLKSKWDRFSFDSKDPRFESLDFQFLVSIYSNTLRTIFSSKRYIDKNLTTLGDFQNSSKKLFQIDSKWLRSRAGVGASGVPGYRPVPIESLKIWVPLGTGYRENSKFLGTDGYRVPARKNILGIDGYRVPGKFSLMPTPGLDWKF